MKPIYKSIILKRDTLEASLKLQAKVYNDGATATQDVQAESLQGLRVQLVSPNVSGARDLIASGECTIDGATLNVSINATGMIPGTHRLVVKTEYGTQTVVLYGLDITVPTLFEDGDAQEFEDTITVVSTIGDGDSSGADATVYAKDQDNAHITKPLSIGGGVATSDGAVASGYTDGEGSSIQASGNGAVASGSTYGTNSSIQASGEGAVASGSTDGTNSSIQASSNGAVASGYTSETSGNVVASGQASQAFGIGVQAMQDAQMVCGQCNVADEDGTFQFIVGNGADNEHRSNAFAVTKSGELALFKADGTPVILTPAVLESLIASV